MGCEGIRGRTGARAWEVIHIYTGSFTPSPDPTPLPSPDLDKEGRVDNQRDTPPNTRLTVQPIGATSDSWVEVALYGQHKLGFLRRLLPFAHGVPSHDQLGNVFPHWLECAVQQLRS